MDPNKPQPSQDIIPPSTPMNDALSSQRPVHAAPAQLSAPNPGHTNPRPTHSRREHQGLRDLLSVVAVLASALLLAFVLISFVFQSYQVDGQSMDTTLQNNDHLLVWKVPRTIARITHHAYIPNRGDIVIFNEPGLAEVGAPDRQLIKRVIGLPGDRVVVRDGTITIYNSEHPDGFQPDKTLPYNKDGIISTTTGNIDITLGKDQLYVCGDNRSNSLDSRIFGPVDASNIVGKLLIRVLPLGNMERF